MLRASRLRFTWSSPGWVVATSLCQSAGRYPPPHGILKLFIEAQAAICVPSTEKCSSDSNPRSSLCSMSSARNFRATSAARARVAQLFEQRRDLPKRLEVRDLAERAVVKLATERKHLTDIIKMVAYQAESDLLALLRPHYARADQEGRTLLHELFATAGDIRVCDRELHITLAPLSSPHRTRAAQPSARCSTKRRRSFPALACACASPCVRHHVSV